ncbi:NADPH:quinone oxidoreductase family protein [Dongia sp.]|uniref:NADPH:quinone oxidoreductase family protein n=1 Tax=Dongia sp. TaxID=1977262 RepID=UPI0035B01BFE
MRALICDQPNGYESLRLAEMPEPQAGPGELLIDIAAAAMNFADTLMAAGKYQVKPNPPFVPGLELAGTVAALGAGVTGFVIGQPVMAVVDHGAFAARAVAKASDTFAIPAGLGFPAAAGFPIAYGTSYGALVWKARLQKGETLLVHGAAGGVGLTAVEIGKALGARVIATAGGADKCAIAAAHGAEDVIDYKSEDVRERVKALTAGRGADVVYDPVGGDLFEASLRAIAWNGRLVVIGFAAGKVQQIPANILLVKNVDALGFYWGSYRAHAPELMAGAFRALADIYAKGQLRPHVSHELPLSDWREGFETLLGRRSTGKIVLLPQS